MDIKGRRLLLVIALCVFVNIEFDTISFFVEKYFFEIRDYLTKKVKDRKAAFALLDGLERLYREMLVTDGPCPVREEKIIEGVNYVEEARRDLQANVNYKYAIRNLILKIGG